MIISTPVCSICGSQMKVRMKTLPDNKGELFWGCSNYPSCKNTLPFNSIINDKALHKAIYDAVWEPHRNYSGDGNVFTSENYKKITTQFSQISSDEFLFWGIEQLKRYKPGDLHNHNLEVGSPHTESLAGFVAYLKSKVPNPMLINSQIPEEWNEIINKIKIVNN